MTKQQQREMLAEYDAGKTAGQLARKYGVSPSYPKWLRYRAKHGRQASAAKAQAQRQRREAMRRKRAASPS